MGFYGNITNVNRTQFSFDQIYSNRKAMDQACLTDGVYLGRFVLVEYDNDGFDGMKQAWIFSNKFYTTSKADSNALLKNNNTQKAEVVYVQNGTDGNGNPKYDFYKRTSTASNANAADFTKIEGSSNQTAYTRNYNIDVSIYGSGRGYDSTVWQKVYTGNNKEEYVMIAELNTVVPTFDIAADAPTMAPHIPHFDTSSTDVYYKLHWQAPWGFRVAKTTKSKSDEKTEWFKDEYDNSTGIAVRKYLTTNGVWKTEEQINQAGDSTDLNAAIYFNKDAFAPYGKNGTITKHSATITENEIKVEPTGKSGNRYNKHDGTTITEEKEDIQEMTINLPAIGNMMSDAWDIIHGDDRKDSTGDTHPSLQGRLNAFSAMKENTIAIKRSSDGTLVGTKINGNTNRTVSNDDAFEEESGITKILNETLHTTDYNKDDAWIKTSINTAGLNNDTKLNGIAIHHTFHEGPKTRVRINRNGYPKEVVTEDNPGWLEYADDTTKEQFDGVKSNLPVHNANNTGRDTLELYFPQVDKAGHVVGHHIETHTLPASFRTITTNEYDNSTTTTGSTTSEPIPAPTTSPAISADNAQDVLAIDSGNQWIRVNVSNDSDNAKLTISHERNKGEYTNIDLDLNKPYEERLSYPTTSQGQNALENFFSEKDAEGNVTKVGLIERLSANNADNSSTDYKDMIQLYYPYVDNAGHVYGRHVEKITLPYGFKTIAVGAESTSTSDVGAAAGSVVADNTQDTLIINPGNKWIHIGASDDSNNDIITLSHEVNTIITSPKTSTNLNDGTNTIIIQDTQYDAAGHMTHNQNHEYTLPYGFKTIKTNGKSSNYLTNSQALSDPSTDSIVADNTQDELSINSGNLWIHIDTSPEEDENGNVIKDNVVTISHNRVADAFKTSFNVDLNRNFGSYESQVNTADWLQFKELPVMNADNGIEHKDIIQLYIPYVDSAGHIRGGHTEWITLPYGYKTIKTNGRSDEVSENATSIPSKTDIVAENTQDALTINSGNKWVRIDTDATNDTITIRHDVHNTSSTNNTTDWTKTEANTTIPTVAYVYDEAGHYVSHHTENYKLPFGYGKIKGDNSTSTAATATYDELTFASDEWLTATVEKDKVIYKHDESNPKKIAYTDKENQYPAFGDSFTIEDWAFDEKGHQFNNNKSHMITIPGVQLVNANSGNVVVGLTLNKATESNDKTATFTESKVNVGNLVLTDYNVVSHTNANGSTDLQPQDTINTAFNKLQGQIYEEEVARANETARAEKKEKEINDSIATLNGTAQTEGSVAHSIKQAIDNEVNDRNTAITTAINNLDVTDTAVEGQYVSAVNEVDGKISVTRVSLPTLGTAAFKNEEDFATANILETTTFTFSTDEVDPEISQMTIQDLFTLVAQLQQKINSLETEIERLNEFHSEENPEVPEEENPTE